MRRAFWSDASAWESTLTARRQCFWWPGLKSSKKAKMLFSRFLFLAGVASSALSIPCISRAVYWDQGFCTASPTAPSQRRCGAGWLPLLAVACLSNLRADNRSPRREQRRMDVTFDRCDVGSEEDDKRILRCDGFYEWLLDRYCDRTPYRN
jgi:hypothetical protein